jgi:hypothetical protein
LLTPLESRISPPVKMWHPGFNQYWYGIIFFDTIRVTTMRISQFLILVGYGCLVAFLFFMLLVSIYNARTYDRIIPIINIETSPCEIFVVMGTSYLGKIVLTSISFRIVLTPNDNSCTHKNISR